MDRSSSDGQQSSHDREWPATVRGLTVLQSPAVSVKLVHDTGTIAVASDGILIVVVQLGLCENAGKKSVAVLGLCDGGQLGFQRATMGSHCPER